MRSVTIFFKSIYFLLSGMLLLTACEQVVQHQHSHENSTIDSTLLGSSYDYVVSNQETVKAGKHTVEEELSIPGIIKPDTRRNKSIAARFGGRIEKLLVKYDLQYVKKGEKVLELYSPELITYQEEYLFLLKSSGDQILIENARKKLRLLGLSEIQMANLAKGKHIERIEVFSPEEGYVLFEDGASSMNPTATQGSGSMEMGNSKEPSKSKSTTGRIREGTYIEKGQTLFSINDLKTVWAVISIPSKYRPFLSVGMPLQITSELSPDKHITAHIDFIEPEFAEEQKFIQARVYLRNEGNRYKINSLMEGKLRLEGAERILIPSTCVFDLGSRKIVWVWTGKMSGDKKIFKRKEVSTGITVGTEIEINHGLDGSEVLAKDAGYLIDSESLLPSDSI